MNLPSVDDFNFKDRQAIVRVDFNVPLDEKLQVRDDTRIRAALPTIKKILKDGGRVILMSHLGRPKDREDRFSLRHIRAGVEKLLGVPVIMAPDCVGPEVEALAAELKNGEVLLLENLRYHKEEKAGDPGFAKQLASLAEVYVNDAFGTAHRAHASTAVIAKFFEPSKRMFGYLMAKEVEMASRVLHHSERPSLAILGGAKVSDKIPIIRHLLPRSDHIIIGGGMAFTFIKAGGGEVGNSLLEEDRIEEARQILKEASERGVSIHLPEDSLAADAFSADAATRIFPSGEIPEGWMGLDIGPKAIAAFGAVILASKTILWNGPMGVFEMKKFAAGTLEIAKFIAEATSRGAFSLVGGGDSVSALTQMGLADKVSYVSTGGGALLEFLEGKKLPGIEAILKDRA